MTMQLKDLMASFSSMNIDEQLEKIRQIRSARHMERPVAAVKRVKREAKTRVQNVDKARTAALKLSPEMRAALIAKLQGG